MALMKPLIIRAGDYLDSLAFRHGFDADEVWAHAKNADLAAVRDPNILAPGDILYIPANAEPRGQDVTSCTVNNYVAKVPLTTVHLVFLDKAGKPIAGEPFEVEGAAKPPDPRKTKGDGSVICEVSVLTRSITFTFPSLKQRFLVQIGFLDPLDGESDTSGLCGRLGNLAYFEQGAVDLENVDGSLTEAVRSFQRDGKIWGAPTPPVSGDVCSATLPALKKSHGC
jgi:hypothetical protein